MQEETLAPHQQTARMHWSVLMTDYEATHATHAWAARYGLVLPGSSKCEFWFITIKEILSQELTLLHCFRAVANDISLFAPFQALPDPKDFGLRKGCGLLEQLVNRIPLATTKRLENDIFSHWLLHPVPRDKFRTCTLSLGCFAMLLGMCFLWRYTLADRTLHSLICSFLRFLRRLEFSFGHGVLTPVAAQDPVLHTKDIIF